MGIPAAAVGAVVGLVIGLNVGRSSAPASPRLLPGYVMDSASATDCESSRCAVYRARLTQAYQRNALSRGVYLISDLAGDGRACAIAPASVPARILSCGACHSSASDLGHEYAFMVYTVGIAGPSVSRRTAPTRWLRVDYDANGHTSTTKGSGATPPPWTHPRMC